MSDNERDSIEDEYVGNDMDDMDDESKASVKEKDSEKDVELNWL